MNQSSDVNWKMGVLLVLFATLLAQGCRPQIWTSQVTATPQPLPLGFGRVTGQITLPPESTPQAEAIDVFFENVETGEIVVVRVERGQREYSAVLPPGTFHAYTWLPGFEQQGAFTNCPSGQDCQGRTLQSFLVGPDLATAGIDITDWFPVDTVPLVLVGTVIDGTGSDPMQDTAVVIIDDRIMEVGPYSEVDIPTNAQVIEFEDATILPGFFNTHVHNAFSEIALRRWAQAGITTVRDLGGAAGFDFFTTRDELNMDPQNARLLAAGPLITVPAGPPISMGGLRALVVNSPEEARETTSQLIADGSDVIKIMLEGCSRGPCLSFEEVAAIVEAAHERGVTVVAHAIASSSGLEIVLHAGVDELAHMYAGNLSDEAIQFLVAQGIYIVPTLEMLVDAGDENLRRFVEAGGQFTLGTDTHEPEDMPMDEINHLREIGMTPMQIIVAATRNAARVCRLENTLGTLEVGKIADVLVVNGDPLQDLQALADALLVVHGGVVIRSEVE